MLPWLGYAIGAAGILVEWRAYMLQCGQAFRRWSGAGALLWAAMYLLLGARTAGLTMAATAARTMLSDAFASRAQKHLAAACFTLLFTAMTAVSWRGPASLAPAFAVISTTLALFYLDNQRMRVALLASSAAWIVNDMIWQAWPALVAETVAAGLNMRTIRRLQRG